MKILISLIMAALILPLPLSAAKKKMDPQESTSFTAEWITRNSVKKLYDTPMGAVYRFTITPYFDFYDLRTDKIREKFTNLTLHSLQFNVFEKEKDYKKNMKRFLVLDFKIRTFPAEERSKNPMSFFTLTRSNLEAKSINYYPDLNGITYFRSDKFGFYMPICAPGRTSKYPFERETTKVIKKEIIRDDEGHIKSISEELISLDWWVKSGFAYIPYYEPINIRVIFETISGGIVSLNINGSMKAISSHNEKYTDTTPFRSFGICLQNLRASDRLNGKHGPPPRTLLELSAPHITLLDTEDELRKLPPLTPFPYPYQGYEEEKRKSKNPDAIYASAMRRIDSGHDLPEAIKLLKDAARDDHLGAMYQLGVCHYRGIGTEVNFSEASIWLKRAVIYQYPDALALSGQLPFIRHTAIKLSSKEQSVVYRAIHTLKQFYGKHDNWILSMILLNPMSSCCRKDDFRASPKLAAWAVFTQFAPLYYSQLPPVIQPKSEKNNVKSEKAFPSHRSNIVIVNHDNFQDKRLGSFMPISDKNLKEESLDTLIAAGYAQAMLYKGRLRIKQAIPKRQRAISLPLAETSLAHTLTLKEALAAALPLFNRGANAGNRQCELEAMFCLAQDDKLKPYDFTPERNMRLADFPLYHLLEYMVKNPDEPGVREFLRRDYSAAREIWQSRNTPWHDFLLAAEALYQFYDYGFDTAWYRIYFGATKELAEAQKQLDRAAEKGIVPALYLSGKQFIDGQRKNSGDFSSDHPDYTQLKEGQKRLTAAAAAGLLKARYELIKLDFNSKKTLNDDWLNQLEAARQAQSPDAWLLSTDILARQSSSASGKLEKLTKAYEQAAKLGSVRALDRLGWLYYKNKDKEQAAKYWAQFVNRDREARKQDPLDIYYAPLKPLDVSIIRDGKAQNLLLYHITEYQALELLKTY